MMMELLRTCKCVPAKVRHSDRYVGDHVIRHYRTLGLSALLRDLGVTGIDTITISGGIGTLTLNLDGREEWTPNKAAIRPRHDQPRYACQELSITRQRICGSCGNMLGGSCSAAGCGCSGEAKPEIWSSRCPLDKWPLIDCNP